MKKALTMVLSLAILALIGCGGEGGGTKTYIELKPADTKVVTSNSPTFSFVINTNNTAGSTLCDSRHEKYSNMVQVKVIKIDEQTANASVVVDEGMFVPNDCHFEVHFPSLILEENVGYAWRVGELNEVENADTKWNSFVYSTISMGSEDANPHACEKNIVHDWTFTKKRSFWRTADVRKHTSALHMSVLSQGHDDNGAANLVSPNSVIFQVLSQPIVQGKYYKLKFSLKHPGKEGFKVKALAYNGQLDGLQPDANTSIIGFTGTIPNQNDWVKISLNPWKANKNFSSLAIALVNDQNQSVTAKIDRVCLVVVDGGGCGEKVGNASSLPDRFDMEYMEGSDSVVTNSEYLLGSVNDLNPDANTSNAEWFLEGNSSSLECTTVGGYEFSQDLEDELVTQELNTTEIEEWHEKKEEWLKENNDTSLNDIIKDTDLRTTTPASFKECTKRIVDYSKPFSGRDIVYVHGLQKEIIDDLTRLPWKRKYLRDKWPHNPSAFGTSGPYYAEARVYWEGHIEHTLGSAANPSNSYLIVTWSALQRADVGINAILHQIRDARAGTNDAVRFSKNGQEKNQCFGDNGIVLVSHSTGGLLVSKMFGEMEIHKNNSNYPNYVAPEMQDLFDAQVGFNAAYGGSAIATAGLMTTHKRLYPLAAFKSVLVDLGLPWVVRHNAKIMGQSQKPTFTLIGAQAGPPHHLTGLRQGAIFLQGFNDSVLTSSSQTGHVNIRPKYWIRSSQKHKLIDLGSAPSKAAGMLLRGKRAGTGFLPFRRYYVSAAFSPSGMLQDSVFAGYIQPRKYLHNFFPIIQTAGDHYDNVNLIEENGVDYYRPSFAANNNEETSVVMHDSLYANGYLSADFRNLQEAWVKQKTLGFYYPRITWVYRQIKIGRIVVGGLHVPRLTWHYYEKILWKRTYHLLKDYKTKNGADYMYEYLLRP